MLRKISTFIICAIYTVTAPAEDCYRISSVDRGNEDTALKYLCQTDSSTMLFFTYTLPDKVKEKTYVNIPKSVFVTDGDISYKLVNAINIPIADESVEEYCILEGKDRKLNFILEFEKFPIDGRFDIQDGQDDEETINIYGIVVDTTAKKNVDPVRFAKSTQLMHCGQFYDQGIFYTFYERDGVFVSSHNSYGDDHFTLYLSIYNDSDHGILFSTGNIDVKGHKVKRGDTVEVDMPLISKNSYVRDVEMTDRYVAESASHSRALSEIESAVSFASIGTPWRSPEYTGLRVVSGILTDIHNNKMRPYLTELNKTRDERTKNYLQSQSIKSGEEHVGFIQIERPKKVNDFRAVVHMDGYDFVFSGYIKK